MLPDETCYFLAMDFDDVGWEKDISVLRDIYAEKNIPFAVERSRSGNGAHVWFFFDDKVCAVSARRFGTALLTHAMDKRHEIKFVSYDRLFPNQCLPRGCGVLSATTAFGKTVIGAKIISVKKVNTLIIVHTRQLLEQWRERLNQFYMFMD